MLSSFIVKKLFLLAICFAAFFQYFIYRIHKRTSAEFTSELIEYSNYQRNYNSFFFNRSSIYIKRVNPIYITYSKFNSALENAVIISNTFELNCNNLEQVTSLNICEVNTDCESCTLEDFIRMYFFEAKIINEKHDALLHFFEKSKCYSVRSKNKFNDYELKSLGLMISLAYFTQTFININFCYNILMDEYSEFYTRMDKGVTIFLEEYDSDQLSILKNIKNFPRNTYYMNTDPNSSLVFSENSDTKDFEKLQNINLHYNSLNMIDAAFRKIFGLPKVTDGMKEFFYNHSSYIKNHLNIVLAPNQLVNIDYLKWVDYSYSSELNINNRKAFMMFRRALSNIEKNSVESVFLSWTGMSFYPNGGLMRLPKIKVVLDNNYCKEALRFDNAKLIVYVRADCTSIMLETALKNINKN